MTIPIPASQADLDHTSALIESAERYLKFLKDYYVMQETALFLQDKPLALHATLSFTHQHLKALRKLGIKAVFDLPENEPLIFYRALRDGGTWFIALQGADEHYTIAYVDAMLPILLSAVV